MRPHHDARPPNQSGQNEPPNPQPRPGKYNHPSKAKGCRRMAGGKRIVSPIPNRRPAVLPGSVESLFDFRPCIGPGTAACEPRSVRDYSSQSRGQHCRNQNALPVTVAQFPSHRQADSAIQHQPRPIAIHPHSRVKLLLVGLLPLLSLGFDNLRPHRHIETESRADRHGRKDQQKDENDEETRGFQRRR